MTVSSFPVGVGIVGAGYISDIYLTNVTTRFGNLRVVGIADLIPDRARAQASKYDIEAMTVDELLARPDVEIVVNLTIPAAHGEVALQGLDAGKPVYSEKPLATTRDEAQQIVDLAAQNGLLVGCAPDTFLGGGMQTARALLDEGAIGTPVAAAGALLLSGHERWHPNPDFYYQPGGGPLFDMGPYYLTALLSLLGPVSRVTGTATTSYPTRTIASGPRAGEVILVETPTHIIATLEFAGGPSASLTTSFDIYETTRASLMLYGTEGTLRLPDPNMFGGPVELLRAGSDAWEPAPLRYSNTDDSRGLGVSDMARALRDGTPPRASGEMGLHVVDIIASALESADTGRRVDLATSITRPEPLPLSPAP